MWARKFRARGEDALRIKRADLIGKANDGINHYPLTLRLQAVKLCVDEGRYYKEVAIELGIKHPDILKHWIRAYKKDGEKGLYIKRTNGMVEDPNKKIPQKRSNFHPHIKLEAVRDLLGGDKLGDILKRYNIPNRQDLYNWRDAYLISGEEAFIKSDKPEKTDRRPLWQQIKRIQMENDLLKKLLAASKNGQNPQ